jgi:hypothetical protein
MRFSEFEDESGEVGRSFEVREKEEFDERT